MTDFGVQPEGFVLKTLDDILTELEESEQAAFGASINTQADSVLGQLNGILAAQLSEVWKVAMAVYRALYPDSASDEALDNVASITGAIRIPDAQSTVNLLLNLASGTTLPAGSLISGPHGARFIVNGAVNNGGGQALIATTGEAQDFGPIAAPAGTLESIVTPVSGWSTKAAVSSANSSMNNGGATFHLVDGQTLKMKVDGGDEQTGTFHTADFVSIGAATALEIATAINAKFTGVTAAVTTDGFRDGVFLVSNTEGVGSSIEITGGTANPAIGFTRTIAKGMNPDIPTTVNTDNLETFDLTDGDTLLIKIDGGLEQTITFNTGSFVDIHAATALEVAAVVNSQITGAHAYLSTQANLALREVIIETLSAGAGSSIEITGGAAATDLSLSNDNVIQGVNGSALLGSSLETDAAFRLRREQLLRLSGASTVEAIRSAVRAVAGVTQAFVFENTTDTTDGDGLPPHSFEAVVLDGVDAAIAAAIFESKPAGIATYRNPGADGRTVTVVDSQSIAHDINFSRPTEIDEYVAVTVLVDSKVFGGGISINGVAQVTDALVAYGSALVVGDDVIINQAIAAALSVSGVIDVTVMKIDNVNPPVNTANIVVGSRSIAVFDETRIAVSVTIA